MSVLRRTTAMDDLGVAAVAAWSVIH